MRIGLILLWICADVSFRIVSCCSWTKEDFSNFVCTYNFVNGTAQRLIVGIIAIRSSRTVEVIIDRRQWDNSLWSFLASRKQVYVDTFAGNIVKSLNEAVKIILKVLWFLFFLVCSKPITPLGLYYIPQYFNCIMHRNYPSIPLSIYGDKLWPTLSKLFFHE